MIYGNREFDAHSTVAFCACPVYGWLMATVQKKVCLLCGGDLLAEVTITRLLPLSARGDNVKVSVKEAKVTAIDMKNAWQEDAHGNLQKIRKPIYCIECGTEHEYHVGSDDPLRQVGSE